MAETTNAPKKVQLEFYEGIPLEDGWYLVEIDQPEFLSNPAPYCVDYCRARSLSDGGGREWITYYSQNVKRWANLLFAAYTSKQRFYSRTRME